MKKSRLFTCACLILSLMSALSVQAAPVVENPGKYLLEPMPVWYKEGFSRGHLNIAAMMQDGFSRLEAVEVQNQLKDTLEQDPIWQEAEKQGKTPDLWRQQDPRVIQALRAAIQRVRQEHYLESGFQPGRLQPHEFYVAFDMDETLLVQWYESGEKGPAYYDLKTARLDTILRPPLQSPDYVSMTPGWQKAFIEISHIPGCQGIILFTAKEDQASHDLINRLQLNNQPLRSFLKGVFTRNHLVRDSKSVKLSKDLRVIDETLEHVVLIDDNPTRIFPEQQKNLREFPKYNADLYLASKHSGKDEVARNFFEGLLPLVTRELKEAAEYSRLKKISFSSAFYPYSMEASAEMLSLIAQEYSPAKARELLRSRPRMFEPVFYVPTGAKLN